MNRRRSLRWLVCGGLLSALAAGTIAAPRATAPTTRPSSAPANPPATQPAPEHRFLSTEEIQKIRRAELQPGDIARVLIPADARRAYAAKAGITVSEFSAKPPVEQALDILSNGDPSMQAQVKVMSDPSSIIEYKRIQQTIIAGCATAGCHGTQGLAPGGPVKGFVLYPAESDPASYTNFYTLMQYKKKIAEPGGAFGGMVEHRLAERGRGEKSLLVQFGLPIAKTDFPHPRAATYNGIFKDAEDSRARRVIDWIDHSLSRIEPDYRVEFRPLGSPPTTAPTTAAASTQPAGGKPAHR